MKIIYPAFLWYFEQFVHNLIDMEIASGRPMNKIILAGHSQGGALALYAALTYKPRKEIWSTIDIQRYVYFVWSSEKYRITNMLLCLEI